MSRNTLQHQSDLRPSLHGKISSHARCLMTTLYPDNKLLDAEGPALRQVYLQAPGAVPALGTLLPAQMPVVTHLHGLAWVQ